METLWAPWRMKYIREEAGQKQPGCLFCPRIAADNDPENLIVHRAPRTVVFMNKYPYNSGHILVMPLRHVGDMDDLSPEELLELFDLVRQSLRAMKKLMNPDGFNIGINLGDVAGAGVPEHLHVHIVPRWNGDTNFMPVVGDVKVIPEHVRETRDQLAQAFRDLT
jgi:ATP adenylyltransferase